MKQCKQLLAVILLAALWIPGVSFAGSEPAPPAAQEIAAAEATPPAASPEPTQAPAPTQAPMAAQSAAPTQSPTQAPEPTQQMPAGEVLQIDNANVYERMDKTYSGGYFPLVQNGVATVILPLVPSGSVRQNQIRVSFNLGDPSSAPFQFNNYDKTVKLKTHTVNNGTGTADSFLVAVDIPLTDRRKMGRYPVAITAAGQLEGGTPFSQEFSLFVTISDGIDPEASPTPEPTPAPEPEEQPVPQAKIMLESFTVNPSPIAAGSEFTISAVFKNTNEDQSLNNVKITAAGETTDIVPVGDETGSFYFERIAKQETVTISMKMKAAQNAKAEPHKVKFAVEYEGHKAAPYTAAEEAVIQVTQPIRLEYDEPKIPDQTNAGDTISVSMNVMNLGLSTVHNVRLSVEAPGLIPEKTAFMGNIESGASKKGDLYVFVGTLDMTDGGNDEKYGATSGMALLTYEDQYGQEYTEEFAFTTNINPPVIMAPEEPEEEEEPVNHSQWWVSVVIGAAIIVTVFVARACVKKRQERLREQEDAA